MWKAAPGSTARLMQLCAGYFLLYVVYTALSKYFTDLREPQLKQMAYLFDNTLGGSAIAMLVVAVLWWPRHLQSNQIVKLGPLRVPIELAYILPSGVLTAVVIPTTTLMYTLGKTVSVMVAVTIMRGSIIVISRLVDEIQIRQGILKKRVYAQENWAVVFALLGVATSVLLLPLVSFLESHGLGAASALGLSHGSLKGQFDFIHNALAMGILTLYLTAYSIRIYIMNYYKNTRGKGVELDNRGFFAYEQIAACASMILIVWVFFNAPTWFGWTDPRLEDFRGAVAKPDWTAVLSGVPFGIAAFFSVFIFMFKGRTATFAGLANRLTSLVAGTVATLLLVALFHTKPPTPQDWVALVFVLVAVMFLSRAEKLRTAELGLRPARAPAAVSATEAGGR
jgi:hypothetical protein